jgi:hypothetical protein
MQGPFTLTVVGGKKIKSSMDLRRLLPVAREVLAEGHSVFLKGPLTDNSIEFRLRPDNTVEARPFEYANERWVAWAMENFQP